MSKIVDFLTENLIHERFQRNTFIYSSYFQINDFGYFGAAEIR